MSNLSLFDETDGTFHLEEIDAISIRTSLTRIAVANLWVGVLLTLAIALVLQSTIQQRRGPVFFIQCTVFVSALLYNALIQFRALWKSDSKFKMPGDKQDYARENAGKRKEWSRKGVIISD
jgi:uncharacterized protein YacL